MSEDELLLTGIEYMKVVGYVPIDGHDLRKLEKFILAKVKQHYKQELRIKNPFEKKLPINSTAGEGAYFRGCYDGFERLRRELKK